VISQPIRREHQTSWLSSCGRSSPGCDRLRRGARHHDPHGSVSSDFRQIGVGLFATWLRVNLTLVLGALWTIPVGVAIGFNPRLARIAQPLAQIAASVPATAVFPVVMLVLIRMGGGLGFGSIVLLLLARSGTFCST